MLSLINNLSQNKIKDNTGLPKLLTSEGYITTEKWISNYFNEYFSNIGSILTNKISKRYNNRSIYTNPLGVVDGNHNLNILIQLNLPRQSGLWIIILAQA